MDRTDYLDELKQRTARLRHDYKVLWTYYKMAQSLLRTLLKVRRIEDLGLEQVYTRLIELEEKLARAEDPIPLIKHLQDIEQHLQRAHYVLVQFDNNISPGVERRYIDRLDDYDPRLLIYLIQFVLSKYPMNQDDWDKVDLLLTKLGLLQVGPEDYELRPDRDLLHIQKMVTKYYDLPFVPPDRVREVVAEIQAIAAEVRRVKSYDDLLEWGLLARIRDFKKNLQHLMLHPQIMIPYLRLNLTTKRKFTVLYRSEIDMIQASLREFTDTEERLELTPPGGTIIQRSKALHPDTLAGEDFAQMFATLANSMKHITSLLERLERNNHEPAVSDEGKPEVSGSGELAQQVLLADRESLAVPEVLAEDFHTVRDRLEHVDWSRSLQSIAYSDPVKPYGLEPFEIEAYQMAFRERPANPIERVAYRLMFLAALCRIKMSNLAVTVLRQQRSHPEQWIHTLGDDTVETIQATIQVAEDFEGQLQRWSREPGLNEGFQRRLNRSHRKLQRARVGLSLLQDQIDEEWALIRGEAPKKPQPVTQIVQVRLDEDKSRRNQLFTWLGWITAFAMFVLLLIEFLTGS